MFATSKNINCMPLRDSPQFRFVLFETFFLLLLNSIFEITWKTSKKKFHGRNLFFLFSIGNKSFNVFMLMRKESFFNTSLTSSEISGEI